LLDEYKYLTNTIGITPGTFAQFVKQLVVNNRLYKCNLSRTRKTNWNIHI